MRRHVADMIKLAKEIYMQNINNKGQAAIEFLVTYGWAILGVVIVIGALTYFGIFNTQRYINDECLFGDQMICEDYVAYNDGSVKLTLRNNFGVDIDVTAIEIKSIYGRFDCNPADGVPAGLAPIGIGDVFEINCYITGRTIPVNDKLRYRTTITFKKSSPTSASHNQTGDVIVTVQQI
jgi:hypothetical protein